MIVAGYGLTVVAAYTAPEIGSPEVMKEMIALTLYSVIAGCFGVGMRTTQAFNRFQENKGKEEYNTLPKLLMSL